MPARGNLAINGGEKAIKSDPGDIFAWPIITEEDEEAALEVLRAGKMSDTDITMLFEHEFAEWQGVQYAVACNTGTAALHSAMWACGVQRGTEIIAPSLTYWATAMPALSLGASISFADIDDDTLCIDPGDIEHRINERTRAIVVVHHFGYPCEMDTINDIARKHQVKVIEDVSHAQGGLYKGRKAGTLGDISAMSLMANKSFPIGEGGIVVTNDKVLFERAVAFGHYERTGKSRYSSAGGVIEDPALKEFAGIPLGGVKYRMHQLSSAVGRVQLRHYDERMTVMQKSLNYFWDLLKGVPGLKAHRPPAEGGCTMGGWYFPRGLFRPEKLDGLPVEKFCKALGSEGYSPGVGTYYQPLHLHPVFQKADIYGDGKPTILANTNRDIRQKEGSLPVSEGILGRAYEIPWFKHYRPEIIEEYASAYRKVAEHYRELL